VDNNAAKNFNILAINLNVLIILMVQTKLFSHLYFSKQNHFFRVIYALCYKLTL